MGLFDGRLGGEGFASAAHLAGELGLPVVLVVGALLWAAMLAVPHKEQA